MKRLFAPMPGATRWRTRWWVFKRRLRGLPDEPTVEELAATFARFTVAMEHAAMGMNGARFVARRLSATLRSML